MIVVNFKNYKTGKEAVKLAKKIERYLGKAIICVSAVDVYRVSREIKRSIKVYSQNVDSSEGKRKTGAILAESIKEDGGDGTLLNHSENKIKIKEIGKRIKECNKNKLNVIVCVGNLREAKKVLKLKGKIEAIAYEDKKLIGTGRSITTYNPKSIIKFVKIVKKRRGVKALCGAGISSWKDVKKSRELGCDGVLIASAIAKVNKPEKLLKEIKEVKK